MANIRTSGIFYPFDTDTKQLPIVKTKSKQSCKVCRIEIPKGSIVLGKHVGYWSDRVCLNCANRWLNNLIKSIELFKQQACDVKKQLKENREEYEATNTSARI